MLLLLCHEVADLEALKINFLFGEEIHEAELSAFSVIYLFSKGTQFLFFQLGWRQMTNR